MRNICFLCYIRDMKRFLFTAFLISLFALSCGRRETPITEVPNWKRAEGIIAEHHGEWSREFESFGLDAAFCEALVFPELMRYSPAADLFERSANSALYVRGGTAATNFSILFFQMKPSFAEEMEAAWMKSPLKDSFSLSFPLSDSESARKERIERLSDDIWQCRYLSMFLLLLYDREKGLIELPPEEQLCLAATAYNNKFDADIDELRRRSTFKGFRFGGAGIPQTREYSYSEISLLRWSSAK